MTEAPAFSPPSAEQARAHPLLARSAMLRLFVMMRRVLDAERMRSVRDEHLRWMVEHERRGILFLSGPLVSLDGTIALNGMTALRAADAAAARRIADDEPYIKHGAMTYELCEWTIAEGALPLLVTLSDSSVVVG